ncbi:MAG: beta-ketoacyl-[acyl-carrier-protein] synthase family protein [Colwellia sp.]|nr:beta-ketoacyl-[acyl-carrier-protein] synthase family protein [Colwellia sp.]
MTNRVVITGMGILSPFGFGVDKFWQAVKSGQNAINGWHPKGVPNFPVQYAATIKKSPSDLVSIYLTKFNLPENIERRGIYALVAAQEAIKDAAINDDATVGVAMCSGVPELDDDSLLSLSELAQQYSLQHALKSRNEKISHFSGLRCSNDVVTSVIANHIDATGPSFNVSGACAGATQAIGLGFRAIRRGEADVMICGGADSVLSIRTLSALQLLGATANSQRFGNTLCRPFDRDRNGLVAGEGGAVLILESEAHALARGAKIYGVVAGYGCSLDAYKVTAPHPEGKGAVSSMKRAMLSAKIDKEEVQYINAHGTSTPLNDVVETAAIKEVFAQHANALMVSSSKSMIGHWIAAAGAPEAITTVLALRDQKVPPTINLNQTESGLDLDYVANEARDVHLNYALSNSFGFGGINATLAFARYR